jgi:DinB family protein/pentapeptide repeat protein
MARFEDQDLTDAEFRECDLTRARLIGVVMQDAVIDGLVRNLVVNGVEVTSYVEAELDRRHPVRLLIRSADPAGLREAFRQLRADWAATLGRLRGMPKGSENQRVGGEWSAVETLRHLVFVHDSWFRRCCLGSAEPFTAIGLASEFVPDQEEQGLDRAATPSLDEVLAARGEQGQRAEAGRRTPGASRCSSACTWCWTRSGRTTASACATSICSGAPRQVSCRSRNPQANVRHQGVLA